MPIYALDNADIVREAIYRQLAKDMLRAVRPELGSARCEPASTGRREHQPQGNYLENGLYSTQNRYDGRPLEIRPQDKHGRHDSDDEKDKEHDTRPIASLPNLPEKQSQNRKGEHGRGNEEGRAPIHRLQMRPVQSRL
jgi:hypothetical protein